MSDLNGRKTGNTSGSGNMHKRGDGLGTGPVGQGGRKEGSHSSGSGIKTGSSRPSGSSSRPSGSSTRPSSSSSRPSGSSSRPSGSRVGGSSGSGKRDLDLNTISTIASAAGSILGSGSGSSGSSSGGGIGKIILIIAAVAILGGGFGLSNLTGCFSTDPTETEAQTQQQGSTMGLSSILESLGISDLISGTGTGSSNYSLTDFTGQTTTANTWASSDNTGTLNTTVATTARGKRTTIKGNNKDQMTIMVYMCGTDLESSYGMGTNDLQEMLNATLSSNINLLVYTGGCKKWKNNVISSTTNQIYLIKDGKLTCVSSDEGADVMTDPETLAGFISWCKKNYPANRYELILWDHGGGSVSGYGYDEKYSSKGSMSLTNLAKALKAGGVTFDFIGFDACLMATADTALTLEPYADYMIASEESEPGIGWYYTDWLTAIGKNSSLDTLSIGKTICDTFVSTCASQCRGQATTLSVVDLAEFASTVPSKLTAFWNNLSGMVTDGKYSTVASARASSHEFASSSKIDQIDLIHFAKLLNTDEGKALEEALLASIKYNRTSSGLSNAYGLSIYFPKNRTSYASTASTIYTTVSNDSSYKTCISNYTSTQSSGQIVSGGTTNYASSLTSLLGGSTNSGNEYTSSSSSLISSLLGQYIGSGSSSSSGLDLSSMISGLFSDRTAFLEDRTITNDEIADQLAGKIFDDQTLNWKGSAGNYYISLTKEQWQLVTQLLMSMYFDDGEGYIDLGLDNIFTFNQDGTLAAPEKAEWLSINGQGVAYYFENMVSSGTDYTINGWVPAYLNDTLVRLQLVFDQTSPNGRVIGAVPVYGDDVEVEAKAVTEIVAGDRLDFVCDYYDYDGNYLDSYLIGDTVIVPESGLTVGMFTLDDGCANMMYRFTDIYNVYHWSEPVTN